MLRDHRLALVIVAAAFACTAGVFLFARPAYHPRYESKMIDFSKQHYYSPAVVRHAFAAHGIRLYSGDPMDGMSWFSDAPRPFTADTLQVLVGPRRGRGSWGPKLEPYDERFGNVMVTYGGNDERLLARVKAAVDDFALGTVSRP